MIAIREFEVQQGYAGETDGMSYRVAFLRGGVVVAEFIRPTRQEAMDACYVAGYQFADKGILSVGDTTLSLSLVVLRARQ